MIASDRARGRDRRGAALLAGLTGLAALLGLLASPGNARSRTEATPKVEPTRVGMMSCAARGCHGAVGLTDPLHGDVYLKDGAYTTWLNFDPHARAYSVLLEPRSVEIARRLKIEPAAQARLCLACHATVDPVTTIGPAESVKDGVACESCHGPASSWQDAHTSLSWLAGPPADKARDGMTDLSTSASRARTCVRCHVGDRSKGMDVNHDLIAAGHPRLNFEFSAFQASYPKHWRERHQKALAGGGKPEAPVDFEAKSWAVGQVVTARAMLDLLAARAGETKDESPSLKTKPAPDAVWPEFAEYECFACHHDLVSPTGRQKPGQFAVKPGELPWATWPLAMLPDLSQGRKGPSLAAPDSPLTQLQDEMRKNVPNSAKVARLAKESRSRIDDLLTAIDGERFGADRVASLMKDLAPVPSAGRESWDRSAQRYLALAALARAASDLGLDLPPEVTEALRSAPEGLRFPSGFDSPRGSLGSPSPKR